jgi:hypothetical protein
MSDRSTSGTGSQPDVSVLANELTELGYIELFHRQGEDALDSVWGEPGAPETLEDLAVGQHASRLANFLAAEILFYKRRDYPVERDKARLTSVYAMALAQDFTQMANPWGLPGELDGLAGQHFVALGEAAIPELAQLLDDESERIYAGSQEATLGNSFRYRVKDFAAFFISEIRGIPFEVHEDPEARDEEIERLKESLGL